MTASNDLDRQLQAYLEASGPSDVRSEIVASALDTARGLRQRRGPAAWVTGPGNWPVFAGRLSLRGLSPALRLGIAAAAMLALVGGSVLVGSRLMQDADPLPPRGPYRGVFESVGRTYSQAEHSPASVAVLPDGRIVAATTTIDLVDGAWAPTRVEAWDPASSTLQELGSAAKPRQGATVVALHDGRVLLIGGDMTGPIQREDGFEGTMAPATAEVFDPATGLSTPTGPRSGADSWLAAILLPDDRVLVAGGTSQFGSQSLTSTEIYDPATNAWTSGEPMTQGLQAAAATRLADGRILLVEPGPAIADRSSHIEEYDPAAGVFSSAGELAEPPGTPGVLLPDGRVLFTHGGCVEGYPADFAGGDTDGINPVSTEIFDPADGSLADGPTLPHCVDTAAALPDGTVLVTGYWSNGQRYSSSIGGWPRIRGGKHVAWAGILDPTSGSVGMVSEPDRYGAIPTVLPNGDVLLVGGTPIGGDPTSMTWGEIFR